MKHPENISRSEKYLSISAFAERYNKSRPTVYKMLEMGILPTIWIGKRLFIDTSDPVMMMAALHKFPGTGNYSGRSCDYKPPKRKNTFDSEMDLRYEIFEAEQEAKRQKRKKLRSKKAEL
jgi:hypothetical protein